MRSDNAERPGHPCVLYRGGDCKTFLVAFLEPKESVIECVHFINVKHDSGQN